MVTQFNSNPSPSHLVGYCRSGAATKKTIEYKIAGIGCYKQYFFDQFFGFGRSKPFAFIPSREKTFLLIFCLTIMPCFF